MPNVDNFFGISKRNRFAEVTENKAVNKEGKISSRRAEVISLLCATDMLFVIIKMTEVRFVVVKGRGVTLFQGLAVI